MTCRGPDGRKDVRDWDVKDDGMARGEIGLKSRALVHDLSEVRAQESSGLDHAVSKKVLTVAICHQSTTKTRLLGCF